MKNVFLVITAVFLFSCAGGPVYTPVEDTVYLGDYEGHKISLVGSVSEIPWQHLVGFFSEYPFAEYFDVGNSQIMIYSKDQIECHGPVLVKGTVVKIEGPSKRPSKTGDHYSEFHLLVDEYECQ